jgi:plastocyanin
MQYSASRGSVAIQSRTLSRGGVAIAVLSIAATLSGADIKGTITVKQPLTRPSVTASVSVYERGPVVELGKDAESDPLADERARVVIWMEGHPAGANAGSAAAANMKQINRRFDPDIVVIPMGGSVTFPNMDPIFHNVFSLSKPKSFDLGNYPKGGTRTVLFPNPGIVFVNCRLHPNMGGVVVVAPNQWFAKADRDGQYSIADVPAGTYSLVAWHKKTGYIRREVRVSDGRDLIVDFLVPIDGPDGDSDSGASMAHMKMTSR